MKTIRKLKLSKQWIVMLVMALMSLSALPLMAANRTIKAVATTGCEVRVYNGSSWGNWTTGTATATVADNKTAKVEARMTDNGHTWSKWTGTYTSTNNPYSWTVTKNATLNANVTDTWTENLIAGATYTVTTVSDNYFKVTCSNTSSPSHNKNFTYVGNITASSGNVTVNFNNTATVYVKGEIKVEGGTLNLRNADNNIVTLKRNGRTGNLLTSAGGKLDIQGNSSKGARFVIDGGAIFPDNDARNVYAEEEDDFTNHAGIGRLIYGGNDGAVVLKNVTLQNAFSFNDNGGAICVHNLNETYPDFYLENVTIQACWAPHGSAVYIWGADQHGTQANGAIFKDVLVQYCYARANLNTDDAQGGTIRTNGGGRTRLTLDNCEIRYNLSGNPKRGGYGGGIYWNAGGKAETKITLQNNTKIHHNAAILASSYTDPETGVTTLGRSWGGGIMIESRMDILSAEIYCNEAKLGGGLYLCTYGGGASEYDGNGFDLTVVDGMKVYGNTATEIGGGAYLDIRGSNDIGFNPNGDPISPHYSFDMQGGEISGNMAPKGAGVAIMDKAPKKHKNSSTHVWSDEYVRNAYVRGGVICNNICTTTESGTQGAGIYIRKFADVTLEDLFGYNYVDAGGAGTMTVSATAGLVCCNESRNTYQNGVGGGMFIDNEIPQAPYNGICTMEVGGDVQFFANYSDGDGGGVYIANGDITINGGTIGCEEFSYDYTSNDGNTITVSNKAGANIAYNGNGAGIAVANGHVTINAGNVDYNQAKYSDNMGGYGGAFYLTGGIATINGGSVSNNSADRNGGGFYVDMANANDTTYIKGGATVADNTALNGGGAYINQGHLKIEGATTSITTNVAETCGGGIYTSNGDVEVISAKLEENVATNGDGGGLYVENGDITLSGAIVTGNTATNGKGGGIYAGNGDIEVKDGSQIGTYTSSKDTSGLGNQAKEGGGLYVNGGSVIVSDGTFADNYASEKGGGIYIKSGATLNLQGMATLTHNYVPATGAGGGVYLDGDLTVGEFATDPQGKHKMKVEDNYAGDPDYLNNVYLPRYESVITLLSDISAGSKDGEFDTHIGFSVNEGFCPVVFADEHVNWLASLMGTTSTLRGAIFDDTQRYIAIHVMQDSGPFDKDYIYLWGCWTSAITSNPGTDAIELIDGVYHIKTNEGLSWFTSLVNGLNHREGDATSNPSEVSQPNLNAVLDADVDMSEFLWVPIGSVSSYNTFDPTNMSSIFTAGGDYTGQFDGQGHVISGLDCRYITAVDCYGLFGTLTSDGANSASVTNTFVDGYVFMAQDNTMVYNMGGIAGVMEGTSSISNCEARGLVNDELCMTGSSVGGLVGKMTGTAKVHSSMAMPVIQDGSNSTYVGGLVGLIGEENVLMNSYTYPMFGTTTNNVGGLVGLNNGTVENCYVRLQPDSQTSKLGWFAATNNGNIRYCYAPMDETTYVKGGNGTLEGHGNYGATALVNGKYGYNHQDQQIELAPEQSNDYVVNGVMGDDGDLTGLLATLNNWVEEADGVYSMWTRTMASTINDDLPILEFEDFVATASNDDVYLIYKDNLNDMIDDVNEEGGVIYMYKSCEEVVSSNTNDNVRVYIAPNTGILQAEDNMLNARVGVVFDNDSHNNLGGAGYDWHMFSTSLADAPMGITYNDSETHYYGYEIPASNITLGSEGYLPANTPFNSFDFYCYSEEYYHWVNFKRHSNDHWHQDEPHDQIPYNNEDNMLYGKGYMMAVDQPTMLMSEGVLNNGADDADVTYTSELSSYQASLRGVNLVGNPYQSYLDASAFLTANNLNTYYILDANANGYIAYTKGGSTDHVVNPSPNVVSYNVIAPAFIHPHQGFFVRVPEGMTKVDFTNDMRAITGGTFRNANVNYPMVNMICSDANGYNDFATIELDRPDMGGGEKIKDLRTGDASIWFSMDDKDWQIAFAPMGTTSAPLRFEAHSDGVYTMHWTTANGDFSYLHLVDHVTGADVDCLATSEYRFEATTHDYQSRFNVVFEFTGVDENSTSDYDAFAFMMDDELVVNGEGVLQVFDVNGRMLKSIEVNGTQTTISLPDAANGVYVLRLTNNSEVRIQKMVINK